MTTETSLKKVSKTEFEKVLERCKDTAKASLEDIEILGPRLIEAVPKIYDLPDKKSSQFLRVEVVKLDDIYCPPMADNPIRSNGKEEDSIKALMYGFKYDGVRLFYRPLIVEECSQIRDGVHYQYKCIDGHHRHEAYELLGVKYVIVAVYKLCVNGYKYSDSAGELQAKSNDFSTCTPTTQSDATNLTCGLISKGTDLFDKDNPKSIKQFIDETFTNMDPGSRAKVYYGVIRQSGIYQNVVTYTEHDNKEWVSKNTDFTINGKFDHKRNMHGWSLQEGYESKVAMKATRTYNQTGKESYFLCRTKAPSEKRPLCKRRLDMLETFDEIGEAILSVAEYYKEHGVFPWHVEGFLPQDHKAEEKDFISVKEIK